VTRARSENAPATGAFGLAGRLRRWSERRGVPEAIRITRVGLWFVLFTVIVGIAATNTGNNALYLVLSFMLALLVVSGVVSRWNLRRLEVAVTPPGELFARRPTLVEFTLRHAGRRLPRWLLQVGLAPQGPWRLVPYLAPGQSAGGALEVLFPRRGRHALGAAHVASLFPLGFFRKGMRYALECEVLVYPELFPAGEVEIVASGVAGDRTSQRPGWGHELHALRGFRAGDDPRGIHWKKSAQTGNLVYQERESDETLRLSILLDNGCGRFASEDEANRFERLVSEAATAAWDHLDRGFEVELVTRVRRIPFGRGARHRALLLTELALLDVAPRGRGALLPGDAGARLLRLGLGGEREAA
jgi:uncharacterized protein (DUF58 family)